MRATAAGSWVAAALVAAGLARAETPASFDELWAATKARSPALRAAELSSEAAQVARVRAGRAIWPRVSLEARAYGTDDPAGSFFALLGQRSIEAADLSPDTLNHPPTRAFGQATLNAEWLAYEGGARAAQETAAEQGERQRAFEREAATALVYTELVRAYASEIALESAQSDVGEVLRATKDVLGAYRVGTPDNPLAYSGRLALEALSHRLEVQLARDEAGAVAARRALAILAGREGEVMPAGEELRAFVKARLPRVPEAPSSRVRALESAASAARERIDVERARQLPQAGVFGTVPLFVGGRGAGIAWTAGAFLRWNALDAPALGGAHQASLESEALVAQAGAERERDLVEADRARTALETAESALPKLEENAKLFAEQTRVARDLFQNGVLNALQLAEVLARRADVAEALRETRLSYVEAAVTLAQHTGFAVPGGTDAR